MVSTATPPIIAIGPTPVEDSVPPDAFTEVMGLTEEFGEEDGDALAPEVDEGLDEGAGAL